MKRIFFVVVVVVFIYFAIGDVTNSVQKFCHLTTI